MKQNSGTSSIAAGRVEAERERDEQRKAAVDAGADRDPQHLRGDQLLDVDGSGEDRVVGALEAMLDEGPEHRRQRAGEDHRGRDHAGADELDVVEPVDLVDDRRAEPEAEGEQVDRRLEHARERGRLPEGAEVRDLAAHHAGDRRRVEPPGPDRGSRRPLTPPPRRSAARRRPRARRRGGPRRRARRRSSGRSAPTIAIAGPAGRTCRPSASAAARTSASRSGGP